MRRSALWLVSALAFAPPAVDGQDLAARVAAVRSGVVRVSYPLREGAQICDRGVRLGEQSVMWRRPGPAVCADGPVRVDLTLVEGSVRDLEVLDLDEGGAAEMVDLGTVTAQEAATYLLSLARGGATQAPVEDAVFAAALARVDQLWRELLSLARDRSADEDVRESALFWLGQDAAAAATSGIAAVAADEREDQDIREAAVFALSQRPVREGVPVLMEIARTAGEAETRRAAMFWLAQADDDDRVIAFFEELLLGTAPR